ncbi:S-layer homology domain-containing protein [Inediibacterium massiliense]|uniref:S-layer homology domain-containing protein n=1 Tax=Inediibacterium massiliense TaxID=1658111 RepID=UPI0006B4FE0E|nr:S-layer homology domain-containing protein [Inediibacterium massiliense]
MKKIRGFCLLLGIVILIPSLGFTYDEKNTSRSYEEGKTMGKIIGQLYKQKDKNYDQNTNWEEVFENEKSNILKEDYFNQKTNTHRNDFKKGFKDGFYLGYKNISQNKYEQKTSSNLGVEHGEWFGGLLGTIHGKEDFYHHKTNDYQRKIPSSIDILQTYDLNNTGEEYKISFIDSYKIAYQQNYIYAFQMENIDDQKLSKENGILHGTQTGHHIGQTYGKIDFLKNKNNNWKNSLPKDDEIIFNFHLLKESSVYRDAFLVGYKDGFKKGYIHSFQNANLEYIKENSNYTNIKIEGGDIKNLDKNVTLSILPGTFYEEVFFSLQKKDYSWFKNSNTHYEYMSTPYEIKIKNDIDQISFKKPVLLSFTYYGDGTGGIYQFIHGEWRYLYSKIDENTISTYIPPVSYKGGIYAILDDPMYPHLKDIQTHWAKEEIYSFVRRHYIYGYIDQTFKPNQPITEEEFIALLKRIKKSDDISFVNEIVDSNSFMTYGEIEKIMQRLLGNENFNWDDIAQKILYEKYTRSKSLHGKKQYILRAEAVYMLYTLQAYNKL